MASAKYFCFSLTLLALAVNLFSSSAADVAVPVPVIHVIRATTEPIRLQLSSDDGGDPIIVKLKKHGQQYYHVNVLNQTIQYSMMAYYKVNSFALVDLYTPARDSGQAAIYWKADNWGFSISYDNKNYTRMVEWETE